MIHAPPCHIGSFELVSAGVEKSKYCDHNVPSRPYRPGGVHLWHRLWTAFQVFRGRYDALDWVETPRNNAELYREHRPAHLVADELLQLVDGSSVCHCGECMTTHDAYSGHSPLVMLTEEQELMVEAAFILKGRS